MEYREQQAYPFEPPAAPPTSAKVLAIISFACGIASLCTTVAGFLFSIPGMILASLSRTRAHGQYLPKARLGKIFSICGIAVSAVMTLALIAYIFYLMLYYFALY